MYKWVLSTLLVVAIVLGVGVMYQNISTRVAAAEQEKAEAGTTLKISAKNFTFDQPTYTVKKGEKLTVKFINTEGTHELGIEGYNVHLTKANNAQEVTFDKPGEYVIKCMLACGVGHEQMHSKLIVQG
jgi:cytochrome c oxidase subunit II